MRPQKTVLIRNEYPLPIAKELAAMLRRAGRNVTIYRGKSARVRLLRVKLNRGEVPHKVRKEVEKRIRAKFNLNSRIAVFNRGLRAALSGRRVRT